ncbi:MAG: glucosyltransferase domain-containing protein [bacterium]|nr:glucosyltransferase domain-containing protein [bacterium]
MRQELQKNSRRFLYLLWFGAVLVSIKSIFTDFGVDNGYAVAASYRHISGDRMFWEMWEPHQTSSFLVDVLMLIYRVFVPSFTGVAIYLQIMGVLLWIPIVFVLHKELSKHIGKELSHLICIFLFVFRAKQTVFPEFSNMQIGFSVLFFVFLIKFICDQTQWKHLILAAVFLCLEIISYPTCIIAYAAAVGILLLYTERKGRNVLAFSGVCAALGTLYVGYFLLTRGLTGFAEVLSLLIRADASHTGVSMSLSRYFQVFAEGAAYMAGVLAIAAAVWLLLCRHKKDRDMPFLAVFGTTLLAVTGVTLPLWMGGKLSASEWHYCIVLALLILLGWGGHRLLTDMEKKIWVSGVLISASSFFAVAVLTNCALMSVVAYLPLAAAVSMIPLSKFRKGFFCAGTVLLVVLLHRGLITCGYNQVGRHTFVTELESIVRTGPAAGIMCDDTTSCIFRDNVTDFESFIEPDDSVFFIGGWGYDPLYYVQAGVDVSASSVISSPTFGRHQIDYWSRYDGKTPTVIAVACYDGRFLAEQGEWQTISEWMEERYVWVGDGIWWRFYRRKE